MCFRTSSTMVQWCKLRNECFFPSVVVGVTKSSAELNRLRRKQNYNFLLLLIFLGQVGVDASSIDRTTLLFKHEIF